MTELSRQCLVNFLNEYQNELVEPIADYGGNNKLYGNIIKNILNAGGISNYFPLDYTSGIDLMKPIKRKFGTGICMDTLEHVNNPFIVAKNITNSLKKNALLFVTVPFIWAQHGYEKGDILKDYFRFTEEGLKLLFPKLHCLKIWTLEDTKGSLGVYDDKSVKLRDESVPFVRVVGIFKKGI